MTMFQKLDQKLKRYISTAVAAILLANLVLLLITYGLVLTNDFKQKSYHITTQIDALMTRRLKSVVESADRFAAEHDIENATHAYLSYIVRSIHEYKMANENIASLSIISKEQSYYYDSAFQSILSGVAKDLETGRISIYEGGKWVLIDNTYFFDPPKYIFYITPVSNAAQTPVALLALAVDISFISKVFEEDSGIFTSQSFCALSLDQGSHYYIPGASRHGHIFEKYRTSIDFSKQHELIHIPFRFSVSTSVVDDSLAITIFSSYKLINERLLFMAMVLCLLFISSFVLLWGVLSKYTAFITTNFHNLYLKMQHFIAGTPKIANDACTKGLGMTFRKTPIRRCIALIMIIFILTPSGIATIFAHNYTIETIQKSYTEDYMNSIFKEMKNGLLLVVSQMNNLMIDMLSYSDLPDLAETPSSSIQTSADADALQNILQRCVSNYSCIRAITLISTDGNSYSYGLNGIPGFSDDTFISNLSRQSVRFASGTVQHNGRYYCVAGKELYSYTNSNTWGYVLFYIDESIIEIADPMDGHSENVFFVSVDDIIISHPDKAWIDSKLYIPGDSMSESMDYYSFHDSYIKNYVLRDDLLENEVKITGIISNRLLFSAMNKMIGIIYVIFGIIVVITILFSLFFPKRLAADITELRMRLEGFASDRSTRIQPSSTSEIVALEESFNKMSDEITHLISTIEEEKEKQRTAEITALQSQINPHFIYNALDAVSWKAKENDQDEIDDMLIAISTFFRIGLHGGDRFIPIADEINHVKSYLYIESLRFPDKFDTTFEIDNEILSCKIIKIILQPIVENAVKHGFKRIDYKGLITIKGFSDGAYLRFEITDNGCGTSLPAGGGFPPSANSNGGYGLYNVNKRLVMQYGSECGLRLKSAPGSGMQVTFCIKNSSGASDL